MPQALAAIAEAASAEGLTLLGGLHPEASTDSPPDAPGTLLLLGPDGPTFWRRFRASPEVADHAPDPLNRWSERVIGALAARFGAVPLFPFGGPPWQPFTAWARASGETWDSPVGLLVHARLGLFVSFRGALGFPDRLTLAPPTSPPCATCAAPCRTACPVGALTGDGYDVAACHAYLDTPAGTTCLTSGCAVRRACPVGADLQTETQSAFHMKAFHGTQSACDA